MNNTPTASDSERLLPIELTRLVNSDDELLSVLYDINLLPEQIMSDDNEVRKLVNANRFIAFVEVWKLRHQPKASEKQFPVTSEGKPLFEQGNGWCIKSYLAGVAAPKASSEVSFEDWYFENWPHEETSPIHRAHKKGCKAAWDYRAALATPPPNRERDAG